MDRDTARAIWKGFIGESYDVTRASIFISEFERSTLSIRELIRRGFEGIEASNEDLFVIESVAQDGVLWDAIQRFSGYHSVYFHSLYESLKEELKNSVDRGFESELATYNNDFVAYAKALREKGEIDLYDYSRLTEDLQDPRPGGIPRLLIAKGAYERAKGLQFENSKDYLKIKSLENKVNSLMANILTYGEFLYVKNGESNHKIDKATSFLISNLPANEKGYLQYIRENPHQEIIRFLNRSLSVKISPKYREKHTYILAKSGSGKSELIKALIYGDILANESAIILIDPHGDLAEQVAFFRPDIFKNGVDDVVYIDPTLRDDLSPSINPFDIPFTSENELSRNTQEILRILEVLLQGADTTAQMSAILEPCIAVLLRMKNASFSDLQRFMDDDENADLIALGRKSTNPQHAKIFENKFQSKQYESTKNGLYTRMQLLLNDPIFQNLISNKTTINLSQLIEQKKVIIFKLSLGEGGSRSMEAFGRFVVGMVRIIALQRSSIPEEDRMPTHLYIDEIQNFITDDLKKVLTQLRKYKVFLTSANQYAGQGYSPEMQKALFSSEVLLMGKNESKTAKEVSNQINTPYQDIQNLSVGEFYLKIGSSDALKLKVSTQLMSSSYKAPKESRKALIENSIKLYYKPINSNSSELKQEIELSQNTATNKPSFTPKFKL